MSKKQVKFTIKYHKKVVKFLMKCDKHIAQKFLQKIEIIQRDPFSDLLDAKPLVGKEKGSFRLRIGKYRFKYFVEEMHVLVYFYDADGRGGIY